MSKHTPGPWQITRAKGLPHAIVAPHHEIGTIPVATVVIANDHEANAFVLGSAPEMLAALKAVLVHKPDCADSAWEQVEEAIAKAEGR